MRPLARRAPSMQVGSDGPHCNGHGHQRLPGRRRWREDARVAWQGRLLRQRPHVCVAAVGGGEALGVDVRLAVGGGVTQLGHSKVDQQLRPRPAVCGVFTTRVVRVFRRSWRPDHKAYEKQKRQPEAMGAMPAGSRSSQPSSRLPPLRRARSRSVACKAAASPARAPHTQPSDSGLSPLHTVWRTCVFSPRPRLSSQGCSMPFWINTRSVRAA